MKFGDQLQSWIMDRDRQKVSQAAIDGFGRCWNRGPVQQAFLDAMARLPAQSAEAIADAARALFADDAWIDSLIGGLAEAMRDDPHFDPPFRAMSSGLHSGLVIFEDEHMSIAAGVTRAVDLAARKTAKRGST